MPARLSVVDAEGFDFDREVDGQGRPFLIARGVDGDLGILPGHEPLLTTLRPGPLQIRDGDQVIELFCGGGFLEVLPDQVTVLADVAERADSITEEAAQSARDQVAARLQGELTPRERAERSLSLEVAEARLRMARVRRGL